jgi:hypothetical protein
MIDHLFPDEPNRARYLPAISHQYASFAAEPQFRCAGFTDVDLDYLSRSPVFRYPIGLSSAGQAIYKSGKVKNQRPTMVGQRSRANTFIITDSGGFQIQQGTIKWYPAGHKQDTVATVLSWQEAHADYVMALDFPTGGITSGNMLPHMDELEKANVPLAAASKKSGLSRAYHACLEYTIRNTDRMLALRAQNPSSTGLLAVLQGRNEQESRHWYKATRHQIAQVDGIAFAGVGNRDFLIMLSRLMDMKHDGLLGGIKHIHVLGTGTLSAGVLLTCIQRNLRAHTDAKKVQITFDTATPFQAANKHYQAYTHYLLDKESWGIPPGVELGKADPEQCSWTLNDWCAFQARDLFHAAERRDGLRRAESEIGRRAKVEDIFYTTVHGPVKRRKPTWRGALLLTLHNVEVTVGAHKAAVDAYLNRQMWLLPQDIRKIEGLVNHAFDPGGYASLKAQVNEYPAAYVHRYVASFDARSHLAKNTETLRGLV